MRAGSFVLSLLVVVWLLCMAQLAGFKVFEVKPLPVVPGVLVEPSDDPPVEIPKKETLEL